MSILIKNVLFNDRTIDIYIEGKEIKQIGEGLSFPADKILDGVPRTKFSLYNIIKTSYTCCHDFVPRLRR